VPLAFSIQYSALIEHLVFPETKRGKDPMPPPVLECKQQIFLPADAAFLVPVTSTIFYVTHFSFGVKVII